MPACAGYPEQLVQMPDAPAVLHTLGDASLLDRCGADGAVAVVGSRQASDYGAPDGARAGTETWRLPACRS